MGLNVLLPAQSDQVTGLLLLLSVSVWKQVPPSVAGGEGVIPSVPPAGREAPVIHPDKPPTLFVLLLLHTLSGKHQQMFRVSFSPARKKEASFFFLLLTVSDSRSFLLFPSVLFAHTRVTRGHVTRSSATRTPSNTRVGACVGVTPRASQARVYILCLCVTIECQFCLCFVVRRAECV